MLKNPAVWPKNELDPPVVLACPAVFPKNDRIYQSYWTVRLDSRKST